MKKIKDSLLTPLIMCILDVEIKNKNTPPIGCTRLSFMGTKITKIGITNDKISGRGGAPLISSLRAAGRLLWACDGSFVFAHLKKQKGSSIATVCKTDACVFYGWYKYGYKRL